MPPGAPPSRVQNAALSDVGHPRAHRAEEHGSRIRSAWLTRHGRKLRPDEAMDGLTSLQNESGATGPSDQREGLTLDLTPRVSAAAFRSAIRASSPFIASAAATPIIDASDT